MGIRACVALRRIETAGMSVHIGVASGPSTARKTASADLINTNKVGQAIGDTRVRGEWRRPSTVSDRS
jgi:hypothetical protein